MKIREKALEIFLEAREMPGYDVSWENHSRNVARVAETVALAVRKYQEEYLKLPCELDVDMAYAAGLLHRRHPQWQPWRRGFCMTLDE